MKKVTLGFSDGNGHVKHVDFTCPVSDIPRTTAIFVAAVAANRTTIGDKWVLISTQVENAETMCDD